MRDILTNSGVINFLTSLADGDLNIATEFVWVIIATALSMVGGAIGGMLLAGKDIGYQFSAMLGALFAPAGAIPAIILGLAVLNWLTNY
ncbi:MAG: asr0689 family protein [Nostoc sp.]